MTNRIVNSITFADNGDWQYTRFEIVDMEDGKVFWLDVESDEYQDLDEDEFNNRWKIGKELKVGSMEYIIEEGLRRGYFIEDEDNLTVESGEIMIETENREILNKMEEWLGVEEVY